VTALQPFTFQDQSVRVVTDDLGEPWFVAADVAKILGYRMASDMTRTLDEDERGTRPVRTPSGDQEQTVLTEPGLYSAISQRQTGRIVDDQARETVRQFKRWVTHDVLPAIRRTGSYGIATMPDLTTPAGILVMAEQFATTARALVASQQKVAELEPKADLADTYLIAQGGNRKVREAAKLLAMRERDLRRFLVDERLIFARHARCGDVQYDFYAEFAHHFQAIEHIVNHTWGSCSHYTLTITPRGIDLIRRRMAKIALPADEAAAQLTSAVSA
jgi:anti-repressor protein